MQLLREIQWFYSIAYKKQSQKAPQHEIEIALRRMKDILGK